MKILYVSPSLLPSRSANSIHVIRMTEAFSKLGHDVSLFAARSLSSPDKLDVRIQKYYGVDFDNLELITNYWRSSKAMNLKLGLNALGYYLFLLVKQCEPDIVISRNLYASFLLRPVARGKLFFETHQLEYGWRKKIQAVLTRDKKVTTIVISRAMKKILGEHIGINNFDPMILHDAAPLGIPFLHHAQKIKEREALLGEIESKHYKMIVGYFGHLYPGRGIEVIKGLALRHQDMAFLVFGGNEVQINALKLNKPKNLRLMGYVEPRVATQLMGLMDVLLMPYQKKVYIGDNRSETARWMSPMKMFEYMATGVPIIASKLPVLQEILVHGQNCLLAEPENIDEWSKCLKILHKDSVLANRIGENARSAYLSEYNWISRSEKIIEQVNICN